MGAAGKPDQPEAEPDTSRSGDVDLLSRAQAEPHVIVETTAHLAEAPAPATDETLSMLRARSIALRVLGRNAEALDAIGAARAIAIDLRSDEQLARCLFSSAPLLALEGQVEAAFAALDEAVALDDDPDHLAEVEFQRAGIALLVADWARSFDHYSKALAAFRSGGSDHAVADALLGRGMTAAYLGDRAVFEADLTEAEELFDRSDDQIGVFQTRWNRALGEALTGSPATAVTMFAAARERLEALGFPVELYLGDQTEALWALGLHEEAVELAEACVDAHGPEAVLDGASRRLELARVHLLVDEPREAVAHATRARQAFEEHGQLRRARYARLIELQSRLAEVGPVDDAIAPELREFIDEARSIDDALGEESDPEWRALPALVAAEAATALMDLAAAERFLAAAERHERTVAVDLGRIELGARIAAADDRPDDVLARVAAGIELVHTAPRLDDSTWIRAVITRKLEVLGGLGLDVLLSSNRTGEAVELLVGLGGSSGDAAARIDPPPADFVGWVTAAGRLHLIGTDGAGAWRDVAHLGPTGPVVDAVEELCFLVRRAFRDPDDRRLAAVRTAAVAVNELLGLGDPATQPSGGVRPVQVYLPPELVSLPLGLLPTLGSTAWVRVDRLDGVCPLPPLPESVGLVCGPGLEHAAAEVARIAEVHPRTGTVATSVPATASAFGDHDLIHASAHSRLVASDPRQSSIHLTDGELALADLEALPRVASTVILASCESALGQQIGLTQVGISGALLASGVLAVIGTALAIPDAPETTDVMVAVHRAIATAGPLGSIASADRSDWSPLAHLIAGCLVTHIRAPLSA